MVVETKAFIGVEGETRSLRSHGGLIPRGLPRGSLSMVKEMTILYKIYEAYFMKSHFPLYKMILEKAKENGYLMMGILDFAEHVKHHETPTGGGV